MNQFLIRRIATQCIEYAIRASTVDPDAIGPFDPDNAAPTVLPMVEPGCEAIPYEGSLSILNEQPTPTAVLEWHDGLVWVERGDMPVQRAHKAAFIEQACGNAILAGFPCDALGAGYFYPAKFTDQINLAGSVMDSFMPDLPPDWTTPFWCTDADGVWAWREHSVAEIRRVGRCGKAAALACMKINEQLQAQITAAENPADLAEINWPE